MGFDLHHEHVPSEALVKNIGAGHVPPNPNQFVEPSPRSDGHDFMRVDNLSCSFGVRASRKVALDKVSCRIHKNAMNAIAGRNGSGKSSLLNALLGLMPIDSGAVYLGKENVANVFLGQRLSLGVVHQSLSLDSKLTVSENLFLAAQLYGLSKLELLRATGEIFSALQFEGLSHKKVAELSGGQKRKVDLARALIPDPELLFLDEASAALDAGSVKLLGQVLRDRIQSPRYRLHTVVTVTHRSDEIELCDELILLDSGKLKVQMSLASALQIERLDKIQLGFRSAPGLHLLNEIENLAKHSVRKVPDSENLFEFYALNGHLIIPELFKIVGSSEILSVGLKPENVLDRVYRFTERGLPNEQ